MMKVFQNDGSVLMEIEEVRIVDGQIMLTGKIMGAMPMKAYVHPSQARGMMKRLGLTGLAKMGWLLMRGKK